MNRWLGRTVMLGALVLVGGCTSIGKMTHDMDAMIQSASTKADHEALAAHYEQEAKALQAKAVEHEQMERAYANQVGYARGKGNLPQHCRMLAAKYREAAGENLELAKEHHQLAAAAPK